MTRRPVEELSDHAEIWDTFSLVQGGPLLRIARIAGLPDGASGLVWLGFSVALLAWAPLVVLTAAERTLTTGPTVPFLYGLGTHARLLVAIPLLFVTEAAFDRRVREVIRTMVASRVVPARQVPRLGSALAQAARWRDAGVIEAALVAVTIFLTWKGLRVDFSGGISTWQHAPGGHPSAAGWWYGVAGLPVFQFLALRWFVHFLNWGHLLWRINRLDLQLTPTHPDRSAGLGPLAVAHVTLAPINFGLSAVIVATFAEQLMTSGADLRSVVLPLASWIVVNTFVLIAPLLLFTPRLVAAKQRGLIEYGELASTYTHDFDRKWLRAGMAPAEPLLGSADVQSLADMGNAFGVVQQMRIVPFARTQLMYILGAAAVPVLPLVLFVFPIDELIIGSVKSLLHI